MILYSKPFVEKIEKGVLRKTSRIKTPPVLGIVLVGNNPASISYIKRKEQTAKKLGCESKLFCFPTNTDENKIISLIKKINADARIFGIIVQLPLPEKFNTEKIISAIKRSKDVDNLRGDSPFVSPAIQAIWTLLNAKSNPRTERAEQSSHDGKPLKKASILIVGYGQTIGRPTYSYLLKKGFADITIADKNTKNLARLTEKTDVIISGAGKANLIKKVKAGAIVIDAGASLRKGKIVGDVDMKRVEKTAAFVTPVPGGVGPLTVAYLFKNLMFRFRESKQRPRL